MDNTKRRQVLSDARAATFYWAQLAEDSRSLHPAGDEHTAECIAMARMWADVANAMKIGDERADSV
jgi:hypothetical protein